MTPRQDPGSVRAGTRAAAVLGALQHGPMTGPELVQACTRGGTATHRQRRMFADQVLHGMW